MTSRDSAIVQIETYYYSGRFLKDLTRLVAHRTESQKAESLPHLHAYLDDEISPVLQAMGFSTHKLENPEVGKGPFLIGERLEKPDLPTVLIYGHGDVVRGQQGQWREGLQPFKVCDEGERIYGRGTADNKGQHLINFAALNAILETRGYLGFNVKVLIEMGEEAGSPGLHQICRTHAEALAADALIASDGPRLQGDTPTIFTGSRGAMNFDLRIDLRPGAHHSGNFGGLLADPAIILTHALTSITDRRGQIQIDEWRPTSLTPGVRALLADLPMQNREPKTDADWGEVGLTPAERVFGWNSFAILAMTSGVPEAPVNAIAGHARATCQLRFVVGTEVDQVLPALRRHLDDRGFHDVVISPEPSVVFKATRLDTSHPLLKFVAQSLQTTSGKSPHILPNLAGSLPNDCFSEVLNMPTIWVPHSYSGCSQHAPNEHILASGSLDALRCMAGLYWDLAEAEPDIWRGD